MAFDTSDYDQIRSMKREDSYSFSYPIEYIIDRVGNENSDEYVIGNTTITVQLSLWRQRTTRSVWDTAR
jgi:hypothetical protein